MKNLHFLLKIGKIYDILVEGYDGEDYRGRSYEMAPEIDAEVFFKCNDNLEIGTFVKVKITKSMDYDLLGVVCGMNGSNAQKNQKIGLSILVKTLNNLNVMPERKLLTVKDFEELFTGETDLILDATEQRIQRPSNSEKQKESYSGKKNPIH